MTTNSFEDLVAEVCMYLHTLTDSTAYSKIIEYVNNIDSMYGSEHIKTECVSLRENTLTFKIRDTQKRICEIDKFINHTRFNATNINCEITCLDALYVQSRQVSERLRLLYRLDALLLTVINF